MRHHPLVCVLALVLLAGCVSDDDPLPDEPEDTGEDDPCPDPWRSWADLDEDGFGDPASPHIGCFTPPGYVENPDDCDDSDDGTFPGAIEVCDGIDRDCNGLVDDDPVGAPRWYRDADGDGFGSDEALAACDDPGAGWADRSGDCDDGDGGTYPGAQDPPCDGMDQDCSGEEGPEAAALGGVAYASVAEAVSLARGQVGEGPWTVSVCPGEHLLSYSDEGGADLVLAGVGLPDEPPPVLVPQGADARILDLRGGAVHLQHLHLRAPEAHQITGDGGAIRARGTDLTLEDVTLEGFGASGDGGAILLAVDLEPGLFSVDSAFLGNRAGGHGGAVAVRLQGEAAAGLTLSGGRFVDNRAEGSGGSLHVAGRASTFRLAVEDAEVDGTTAGIDGGFVGMVATEHGVVRLLRVQAKVGRAGGDGGFVALTAPGDAVFAAVGSRLEDGLATRGGHLFLDGATTLDLELDRSLLEDGTADAGGLIWARTGLNGQLYRLDTTLSQGRAPEGAGLWLTGRASTLNGTLDGVRFLDHDLGPALEVDPDFLGPPSLLVDQVDNTLERNAGGGVSGPGLIRFRLDHPATGVGPDENGLFDVRTALVAWRLVGPGIWSCEAGSCTRE